MDNKQKFFNQTFKVLVVLTITIWAIYVMLLLFAGTKEGCTSGAADRILTQFAWVAGICSAPPIAYGLVRLLQSPTGGGGKSTKLSGWIISCGAAIFVAAVILFAIIIAEYGCQ